MAKETISLQDPLAASGIDDPSEVLFAVDHTGDTATYRLALSVLTEAQASKGTCLVRHADGTYAVFEPTANTRAARGAALSSALGALVTQTAVNLPGSTLFLPPNADYQGADLTVTSKDGIRIIGRNNVIWNTPSTAYDHILRFTTCDDVHLEGITVQGDGELSSGANPASVTNTGTGVGIYFHTCARPHVVNCGAHGMTGAAKSPYPYNGEANGLYFVACTDIYVDGFRSNYAGCYGLATIGNSSRIDITNCVIYNARARSMQLTPASANPYINVSDCVLISDQQVNTLSTDTDWFSYIPMIDIGNTGALVDTVTLSNVRHYWISPSASQTSAGAGFPLLKIQDCTHVRMSDCTLWHGASFTAGTGSPYTLSVITQNSSGPLYIEMTNCYLSMDFTTTSYLGSYQPNHLRATNCRFGADLAHSLTFYNFHGTMIVRDCTFSNFTNGVFDNNRDAAGYVEATGCTFNGSGSTNNVFFVGGAHNTNALSTWAGDILFANNTYNNCRPAASSENRLLLNQETGDRNVLVYDDNLAGDNAHPSPGTSPSVFSTVGGQEGMRILNKNYQPDALGSWASEWAWWSTTAGAYTDEWPNDTAADQDATPSVAGLKILTTANTLATTITDLDDGIVGQTVIVKIGDGNTTIDFTASGLKGNAGADWSPAAGDHMVCTYDGTDWLCVVSDNTA